MFAGPDAGVPVEPSDGVAGDFDDEMSAQGDDGDVGTDAANAKVVRVVLAYADGAGAVCVEILGFGGELAVGAGEEEVVVDESIERRDVGGELGGAKLCLESDDLGIGISDEDGLEQLSIGVVHANHAS